MISDACYDFLESKDSDKLECDIRYYLSNIIYKSCYSHDVRIRCKYVMRSCTGTKLDLLITQVKLLLADLNLPDETITKD